MRHNRYVVTTPDGPQTVNGKLSVLDNGVLMVLDEGRPLHVFKDWSAVELVRDDDNA